MATLGTPSAGLRRVIGDRVTIYVAQRGDARARFGNTSIPIPGRQSLNEPALSIKYARELVDFWQVDASRVAVEMSAIASPHTDAYLRAGEALGRFRDELNRMVIKGSGALDDQTSVRVWRTLDPIVIGGMAVSTTPGAWDVLMESIAESAEELLDKVVKGPIGFIVAAAAAVLIGVFLISRSA